VDTLGVRDILSAFVSGADAAQRPGNAGLLMLSGQTRKNGGGDGPDIQPSPV
jgi:hypothetical protein